MQKEEIDELSLIIIFKGAIFRVEKGKVQRLSLLLNPEVYKLSYILVSKLVSS